MESTYDSSANLLDRPSPDEQERAMQELLNSDEILTKAASAAPAVEEFQSVEAGSRLEDRVDPKPTEPEATADEDYSEPASPDAAWQNKPSIKDQVQRYPDSVRTAEPVTVLLDMAKEEDIKILNDIQKAAADPEAPTKIILEKDVQKHKGSWTILLTHAKVEYLKMN